ncbi:pickpocket protein 19 [Stomoxys calcitrans]|uniref:pickpocket protein 19 n=1 Tax=Stomoxys calcitrans TaxID=35570 RepID=UPI0027E26869|nr:pickpocket protein 19 [Stomoxys calcitrans]
MKNSTKSTPDEGDVSVEKERRETSFSQKEQVKGGFKPAQPEALRRLNQKYASGGEGLGKKSVPKVREDAMELLASFSEKTTVHGMGRIFSRKANKYERCFWLLTFSLAVFGTTYVCIVLSERFKAGNLQSIVDDTGAPVYKIPFPVITICNVNHLNWDRIDEAKQRFLPGETNNETLQMFEKVIGLFDRLEFGRFNVFSALENQSIHLVEQVNFTQVFEFMTWRCEELLTNCMWRHREMECCDIFLKRRSKNAICWSFNTVETPEGKQRQKEDAKYPWRTGSSGPQSALSVRAIIDKEKHYSYEVERGITVMITEPNVWHRDPYFIQENTETTIGIDPTIYQHDDNTRSLSSTQRQCIFHDEHEKYDLMVLPGFEYNIENCEAECHQMHLEKYCNCTMDLLFPPGKHRYCGVKDLLCLARNNDYFMYTYQFGSENYLYHTYEKMRCKCFNNCYSLQYMTYVRPTFLPADVRGSKSYVDLDIHFRSETMMIYRTSLVFTWIDLMVAFGGIAGLFMGCSLISAVEVLYFLFIQVPTFAYKEFQNKKNFKRKTPNSNFSKTYSNRVITPSQRIII